MQKQIDKLFLDFQATLAGRYSLERELGRGGMGVVCLAREVRLDRLVAIKLLPPELAVHGALKERFVRSRAYEHVMKMYSEHRRADS